MTIQEKIRKKAEGYEKLYPVFIEGAEYALENQWISVKDDLPCNHKELVEFNRFTNKYSTKFVLVIDSNGFVQLTFMEYDKYSWIWNRWEVLYWMPIPELPEQIKD